MFSALKGALKRRRPLLNHLSPYHDRRYECSGKEELLVLEKKSDTSLIEKEKAKERERNEKYDCG